MKMIRRQFLMTFAALFLLVPSSGAKRMPSKPVTPIISNGIRYSADGDAKDQYVVAQDVPSGKILWKAKVFHNHIKFWMEIDVQWVCITDLKLVGNSILVSDERSRCYSLDLTTKRVKKRQCDVAVGL
jgi:hypothetical protein